MQIIFFDVYYFCLFIYRLFVDFVLVWDVWVFLIFIKNNLTWITRKQQQKIKQKNSNITIFCLHANNLNVAKSNVNLVVLAHFI